MFNKMILHLWESRSEGFKATFASMLLLLLLGHSAKTFIRLKTGLHLPHVIVMVAHELQVGVFLMPEP